MYLDIVDRIVKDISNGEYDSNEKLPSDRELVYKYKTTRYEVRKAFDRLTEMGYIYSTHGKGRYCKSKTSKIELLLTGDESFTEKMTKRGYPLITENIQFTELEKSPVIRTKLDMEPQHKLYKITRLRIINQEPAAIHISFLSDKLFSNLKNDGPNITSMFEYYRKHGFVDYYYQESNLQTLLPSRKERNLLNCPSLVPVLLLESQCFDKKTQEILEITKIIYRGDRFLCRFRPEDGI